MLLRRRTHEQQPNKSAQLPWRPEKHLYKHVPDSVVVFLNAQNVAYVGRPPFFLCHALKRPDHIRACRRTLRHMGGFLGIPALATQTTPPSTCIDKARALRGRWNFPFSCCAILLIFHTNRAKGTPQWDGCNQPHNYMCFREVDVPTTRLLIRIYRQLPSKRHNNFTGFCN